MPDYTSNDIINIILVERMSL